MIDFLKWYLLLEILGWISLPVTWSVFQKLRSKGVYLSKVVGLLLWGFVYWWLTSIGLLKNDLAGAVTVLVILLLFNLYATWKIGFTPLKQWVEENRKIVIITEVVFFVAFVFWTVVRAANPDIIHTEKFMEMAFINGILKSPGIPPQDPWLSGYSISYYYFGYLISALLIRVSGVVSSVGYNLVSASWFGLTALGAYGVAWDLLGKQSESEQEEVPNRNYTLAMLAPLMILIVSNWFGLLDVLHARGLVSSGFWQNLQIPALTSTPYSLSWYPDRGGWSWWQASRVIQDFRLGGSMIEIIDEFPFFTYLLSDIHPHLLGMPFVLLAIAQALNAFHGGWEGEFKVLGHSIPINWKNALMAVITLGGIAFLNTWDFPFYLLLLAVAFIWRQASSSGWSARRLWHIVLFCLIGGILSILAYLPFYLSFSSQAGGLIPSLAFFTRGAYLWIMFGPLLIPIFAWLLYRQIQARRLPSVQAFILTLSLFALLFLAGWGLGWLAGKIEALNSLLNNLQGATDNTSLLTGSFVERLKHPGSLLTLFFMVLLAVDYFIQKVKESKTSTQTYDQNIVPEPKFRIDSNGFVLMLVLLGALLVIVPEFVYLRDQFGTRMNTIFKFYFQAWILWSLAGSYFIANLMLKSKPHTDRFFALMITMVGLVLFGFVLTQQGEAMQPGFGSHCLDYLVLSVPVLFLVWIVQTLVKKRYAATLGVLCLMGLAAGLIYPMIELWNKTEGFQPRDGYSLDGKQDFYQYSPNEMAAAEWLANSPTGIMAEAVSETGGSYTTYNIISTFSGMPTILGWIGHESQWRGGYEEIGSRQSDLRVLYSTAEWSQAQSVIDLYNIKYIVVGELERQTYQVDETKFEVNMKKVFDSTTVDIYEVKNP